MIDSLGTNVSITAVFGEYMGYKIPKSDEEKGYTIDDIVRTPANTEPKEEIRQNGDLTFTVAPSEGFDILDSLIVDDYDCLKGKLIDGKNQTAGCDEVEVKAEEDGTYTITSKM